MRPLTVLIVPILLVFSCSGLPKPDFSWEPAFNPEAGDTLRFINHSKRSDAFNWEFGDGGISNSPEPAYVYRNAGIFDVTLEAFNDEGTNLAIQPIKIFEPTILGFEVFDSTGFRTLDSALVQVFVNKTDRDSLRSARYSKYTGPTGRVEFRNVEPMVYHIYILREEQGMRWFYRGFTNVLTQNKVNYYTVACTL